MKPDCRYDGWDGPRVAIAHDYLTQRGGAEKVVLAMSRAFPDAPIYTMLFDPDHTYPEFADRDVRVSSLNKVRPFRRHHRAALPVLALAAESMFVDADIVLTSSSGWAHGFRTNGRKLVHCHTPAHWLYTRDQYLGDHTNFIKRLGLFLTAPYLRVWDRRAASSCDRYMAISAEIQKRIADAYGIEASLVPSPVSMSPHDDVEPVTEVQRWVGSGSEDVFYLCVSRLMPYKNVDAVVAAFSGSKRKLVVVGTGPEAGHLKRMATPNVLFVSDLTDAQLGWLYSRCRALIAAGWEDYGLTPIEAAVWGKPSVVLRWGGFLDTVAEGISGLYFEAPEPGAIARALSRLESEKFDADKIRHHAEQFSERRFAERLYTEVDKLAALVVT